MTIRFLLSGILVVNFGLTGCRYSTKVKSSVEFVRPKSDQPIEAHDSGIDTTGNVVATRFVPPPGYQRIPVDTTSFGYYLRHLPLKPHNTNVKMYDGSIKYNHGVYDAVVDLPIGSRDLHQCADAVIRLRAEYLYAHKKFDAIHFNFTNGWRADYSKWMQGNRVAIDGNKTWWVKKAAPSNNKEVFWQYLQTVFSYAGTLSLSGELKPVIMADITIGDVFIRGGSPGHAIIVVDMVHNDQGEKLFLLAQSYMPAQELQILKNPQNDQLSPWYDLNADDILRTPEWTFELTELRRFED